MPISRQAVFQLGLLLLAVPGQYLISKYTETNESQRSFALRGILASIHQFFGTYLSPDTWKRYLLQLLGKIRENRILKTVSSPDESPAIEVIKYREKNGYYAGSSDVRSPRPPHVKYRVGQVIKLKKLGYHGVIVGWDEEAKAPNMWLNKMYLVHNKHYQKLPHYSILLDARDSMESSTLYVVEEKLEIISNMKILHPRLDNYFEKFDGAQYLPRPWLRAMYPDD